MKVKFDFFGSKVKLSVMPDTNEELQGIGQLDNIITLEQTTGTITFPSPLSSKPHPDLQALAALSISQPFIKERLVMEERVSDRFRFAVQDAFGIDVGSVNAQESSSPRNYGTTDTLAYTGGVDSVASDIVLPDEVKKWTYLRVDHEKVSPRRDGYYSGVKASTEKITDYYFESDIEYMVGSFLQWAAWAAVGAPLLLFGDELSVRSVSYGHIADYMNEVDYTRALRFADWRRVYEAAGIKLVLPVAGITELGTLTIVKDAKRFTDTHSCHLGENGQACRRCHKCFRKELLACYMGLMQWHDFIARLDVYYADARVQKKILLKKLPINLHPELSLVYNSMNMTNNVLLAYREKINYLSQDLRSDFSLRYDRKYTEQYMGDSKLFDYVDTKISEVLQPMEQEDYRQIANRIEVLKQYKEPVHSLIVDGYSYRVMQQLQRRGIAIL